MRDDDGVAPGSPSALREANRARVLTALDHTTGLSQADLARATGLSPAAISGLVQVLSADGLVDVEVGVANGRRSRIVRRASGPPRLGVGVDVGRTHVRLVVGSNWSDIALESVEELPAGHSAAATIDTVAALVDRACTTLAVDREQIHAIGVGVPGPVDVATGTVAGGSIVPAWMGLPVRRLLADAVGRPVVVDNDANMGARAVAAQLGSGSSVVFLKVASGIGAGIVLGGQVLRGPSNTVGEIGHLTMDPRLATVCRCGRRGCLETLASADAVREAVRSALDRVGPVGLDEVMDLVRSDHAVATRVVEEAAETTGRALGWLAMVLNPRHIVLGGPFIALGETFLEPVRRGLGRSVLPGVAADTEMSLSPLGERTEAVGALVGALASSEQSMPLP